MLQLMNWNGIVDGLINLITQKMENKNERRTYVTPEMAELENDLVEWIIEKTGDRMVKLPFKYGASYLEMNDAAPIALVEIKIRDIESTKYPDYSISLSKCVTSLIYSDALHVPFELYVRFADKKIGRKRITWEHCRTIRVSEKSNNDRGDIEPLIKFATDTFQWM